MNMQNLMAQAQKVQRELAKTKEEIDNTIFTGTSEWVTVEMNGKKELQKITINYDGSIDQDDKEALEDMIKIAINQAVSAIDKETESKMGAYTNGLGGLF